jgi:hypothetical protein
MKNVSLKSKKIILALAVSAAASQASALRMELVSAELQNWEKHFANPGSGYSLADISGTTARFDFDGNVLASSGTYESRWILGPTTVMWTRVVEDLSIVMGGSSSATSYECVEGNFGGFIGTSFCGNYEMGANYFNESSLTYNIGGDAHNQVKVMGGDDVDVGPAQALSDFDNWGVDDDYQYAYAVNAYGQVAISDYSWNGTTLKIHNMTRNFTQTLTFTVSAVPVPAAAWLFGSAVLGLAGIKRNKMKNNSQITCKE